MLKLITTVTAASTFIAVCQAAAATSSATSPRVSNYIPTNGWEIYDFFTGFILSGYGNV